MKESKGRREFAITRRRNGLEACIRKREKKENVWGKKLEMDNKIIQINHLNISIPNKILELKNKSVCIP